MIDFDQWEHAKIERCTINIDGGPAVLWWLVRWTSDVKVGGSSPDPCRRCFCLDTRNFVAHCLSRTGERVAILLDASRYRSSNVVRLCLVCDFTFNFNTE